MKILVLGSHGLLGSDLVDCLDGHELFLPDEKELDITEREKVLDYITTSKPDVVINCAAYTNVDGCEDKANHDIVFNVNGNGHWLSC